MTQGRYGAKLVEGDEYLLKLSRYVHLNPVKVAGIGLRNEFVDYGPLLALVGGRSSDRAQRYQIFVESGMAGDNEEFLAAMVRSVRSIGSDKFREQVDERYRELVGGRQVAEDVAFRRGGELSDQKVDASFASGQTVCPDSARR